MVRTWTMLETHELRDLNRCTITEHKVVEYVIEHSRWPTIGSAFDR